MDNDHKIPKEGLTLYFCITKNKKFSIKRDGPALRILLGRVSLCIGRFDVESLFENLIKQLNNIDTKIQQLEIEKEKLAEDKYNFITQKIEWAKQNKNSLSSPESENNTKPIRVVDKKNKEIEELEEECEYLILENEQIFEELVEALKEYDEEGFDDYESIEESSSYS